MAILDGGPGRILIVAGARLCGGPRPVWNCRVCLLQALTAVGGCRKFGVPLCLQSRQGDARGLKQAHPSSNRLVPPKVSRSGPGCAGAPSGRCFIKSGEGGVGISLLVMTQPAADAWPSARRKHRLRRESPEPCRFRSPGSKAGRLRPIGSECPTTEPTSTGQTCPGSRHSARGTANLVRVSRARAHLGESGTESRPFRPLGS